MVGGGVTQKLITRNPDLEKFFGKRSTSAYKQLLVTKAAAEVGFLISMGIQTLGL